MNKVVATAAIGIAVVGSVVALPGMLTTAIVFFTVMLTPAINWLV
jgi:hypothetical protein